MINRRESLLGGLLTLVWGSTSCCSPAHADTREENSGCMLEDDEAKIAFTAATPQQTFTTGQEKLLTSSGDTDLDFALGRTLARLSKTFGVLPGFAFVDGPKSNNAWATTKTLLKRADGTVLFGRSYLTNKLKAKEAPDAWVAAVCAHEFGHILQYKLRLQKSVFAGQPTVKRQELHADFLAGYFAGVSKLRDSSYPAAIYAMSRHASGDFSTKDKGHHGTPDERANAVIRGFETAYREKRGLSEAIQIGNRYVSTL